MLPRGQPASGRSARTVRDPSPGQEQGVPRGRGPHRARGERARVARLGRNGPSVPAPLTIAKGDLRTYGERRVRMTMFAAVAMPVARTGAVAWSTPSTARRSRDFSTKASRSSAARTDGELTVAAKALGLRRAATTRGIATETASEH